MSDLKTVASRHLDAWRRKDAGAIAAGLHPSVRFVGPMTRTEGREPFMAAAQRMFPMLVDLAVRDVLVDGGRAVAIYDFVCREPIGVCRTAELIGFEDGLIRSVELFFDARPFEALMGSRGAA